MPEPFRSLASIFARRPTSTLREEIASQPLGASVPAPGPAPAPAPAAPSSSQPADERIIDLLDSFVAELARLRARAAERLEEHAEAILENLARRVLARELATAPPAIEALILEALSEIDVGNGIRVRVSASDAERLLGRWPVEAEAGLGPGDFAVEIDDGRYDATLQTRFEAMLASHRIAV